MFNNGFGYSSPYMGTNSRNTIAAEGYKIFRR